MEKKSLQLLIRILKFSVALAPLIYIAFVINWSEVIILASSVPPWVLIVAISSILISMYYLQSLRFWMILKGRVANLDFRKVFVSNAKGMFYSLIIPSSAGQDVARGVLLAQKGQNSVIAGATFMAKVFVLFSLISIVLAGIVLWLLSGESLDETFIQVFSWGSIFSVVAIALMFSKKITAKLRPLVEKVMPQKISSALANARQSIYLFRHEPALLFRLLALTILVFSLGAINNVLFVYGITGRWEWAACLLFLPLVEVAVMVLPFTPNGIGVRDVLLLQVLSNYMGLSDGEIGLFLLFIWLGIILRLLGGIAIFLPKAKQVSKESI